MMKEGKEDLMAEKYIFLEKKANELKCGISKMGRRGFFKGKGLLFLVLLVGFFAFSGGKEAGAAIKVKLGETKSVAKGGAKYSSLNPNIASVNKEGAVIGKKIGKAVIVRKVGSVEKRIKVKVVANGRKKRSIAVSAAEIDLKDIYIYTDGEKDGKYKLKLNATLKNTTAKKAKKVKIIGNIAGKEVEISCGNISPGKVVKRSYSMLSKEETEEILGLSIEVYSNKMITKYNIDNNTSKFLYGTPDTTGPEIEGFVGKKSYNTDADKNIMPYMVEYVGAKKHKYKKHIEAYDEREGKVDLKIDDSKVNYKKAGIYTVKLSASDSLGNTTKKKAKIEIRKEKRCDMIADEVLSGIIKKKWSDYKKATAIYNYTRKHVTYVGYSDKTSWEKEAMNGIMYGKGDCFTYYAVARLLLTRAGIPNLEVTRVRGEGHHWWSMVYVKGGWYHYDCGPRAGGGRFCLLTDSQLTAYSKTHGNKYIWDYKKKPKTPKKKLTTVF